MNVKTRNNLWGYLFIGPFIIGFLAFTIIPIVTSFYLSFTKYDLFSTPQWIGFGNFKKMFTDDPKYLQSDRKSTRLNSSHVAISYAVVCLKQRISQQNTTR